MTMKEMPIDSGLVLIKEEDKSRSGSESRSKLTGIRNGGGGGDEVRRGRMKNEITLRTRSTFK